LTPRSAPTRGVVGIPCSARPLKRVQMQGGARCRGTHRRWVGGVHRVRRSAPAAATSAAGCCPSGPTPRPLPPRQRGEMLGPFQRPAGSWAGAPPPRFWSRRRCGVRSRPSPARSPTAAEAGPGSLTDSIDVSAESCYKSPECGRPGIGGRVGETRMGLPRGSLRDRRGAGRLRTQPRRFVFEGGRARATEGENRSHAFPHPPTHVPPPLAFLHRGVRPDPRGPPAHDGTALGR